MNHCRTIFRRGILPLPLLVVVLLILAPPAFAASRGVQVVPKEAPKTVVRKKSPKGINGRFQLTQLISSCEAEEYLANLEWERYEAYLALLSRSGTVNSNFEDSPVLIVMLKDRQWQVEFQGQRLGAGSLSSKPQPVRGNTRETVLKFMERELPNVYRAHIGGDKFADLGIVLASQMGTHLRFTAFTGGSTIQFKFRGIGKFSTRFEQAKR